jgi:predicted nucleotidyltransferase
MQEMMPYRPATSICTLIDAGGSWGYFKLCGFQQDLEACFGVNVDVLTTGTMDQEVLDMVRRDEVVIYEQ